MEGEERAGGPTETRLRDLRVGSGPVGVVVRIVAVERREVRRRSDGGARPILSGLLSDGTATVRFTWWDPPAEEVGRGLILRAAPVDVREFRGRPELSFGWRTRVASANAAELPRLTPEELRVLKVADLSAREEGFRLDARVVEVGAKGVTVGEERREIHQGLLGDSSGLVAFTAWVDFRLRAGEAVRITGAYVREFRSRPQLVLDERAEVERFDGTGLPAAEAPWGRTPVPIAELLEATSLERVTVAGRAVATQPPSGLVARCTRCARNLRDGACRVHGPGEGRPDLRLRLVLDDGTGVLTVELERPEVERLTGRTLAEVLEGLRTQPDPSAVERDLRSRLFGLPFRVRGAVRRDEYGLSMDPTEVVAVPAGGAGDEEELRARLRGASG